MMRLNKDPDRNALANKKSGQKTLPALVGLAYGQGCVFSGYLPELDVEAGCD